MKWLAFGAALGAITVHLGVYYLLLRRLRAFSREKTIFLYHLLLFSCAAALLGALLLAFGEWDLLSQLGITSLFAIYSMTFLESWSLSQGSYSFSILSSIKLASHSQLDVTRLRSIGTAKLAGRIDALVSLQLAEWKGDQLTITLRGRAVTACLRLALWLINVRRVG